MWQDPVVSETRLLREEYALRFDHDADAIFQDILRRQAHTERRLVRYKPRKPIDTSSVAPSPTEETG